VFLIVASRKRVFLLAVPLAGSLSRHSASARGGETTHINAAIFVLSLYDSVNAIFIRNATALHANSR
jgi:hypothetical protein